MATHSRVLAWRIPGTEETGGLSSMGFSRQEYWSGLPFPSPKLEVVKQEMARVNMNILGISELKWTGMDKFNTDNHYIYSCVQISLRKNGIAIIVNRV